jgi:DUF971 family protein
MDKPTLAAISLHKTSRTLELGFDDGSSYHLSCEYLRVFSPSAEVKGHGQGQEILQTGKKNVQIAEINPVGNYAIQLTFDDAHKTGIYSWKYLRDLCTNEQVYWQDYLDRLEKAGGSRDPDVTVLKFFNAPSTKR